MIETISRKLSKCVYQMGEIDSSEEIVYKYGFELLISSLINLLLLIGISLIFNQFKYLPFFLLSFVPLRTTLGGYHAKTHFSCMLVTVAVFCLSACLYKYCLLKANSLIVLVFSYLYIVIVILIAPVKNDNKPMTCKEERTNKLKALLIVIIFSLLSMLNAIIQIHNPYNFVDMLISGETGAVVMAVIAKCEQSFSGLK